MKVTNQVIMRVLKKPLQYEKHRLLDCKILIYESTSRYGILSIKKQETIQKKLSLEIWRINWLEQLQSAHIFKGYSPLLIRGYVVRLRPQIVVRQDYILNKGDSANAIFFIGRGDIEILSDYEGKNLGHLGPGDYFDVAVLCCRRTTAVAEDLRGLLHVCQPDVEKITKMFWN